MGPLGNGGESPGSLVLFIGTGGCGLAKGDGGGLLATGGLVVGECWCEMSSYNNVEVECHTEIIPLTDEL